MPFDHFGCPFPVFPQPLVYSLVLPFGTELSCQPGIHPTTDSQFRTIVEASQQLRNGQLKHRFARARCVQERRVHWLEIGLPYSIPIQFDNVLKDSIRGWSPWFRLTCQLRLATTALPYGASNKGIVCAEMAAMYLWVETWLRTICFWVDPNIWVKVVPFCVENRVRHRLKEKFTCCRLFEDLGDV
jgi:hypothetical protein